jgi:hypothetical protein
MIRVFAMAVFVAAMLVVVAAPAFARPKFGHEVPTTVCSVVVEEGDSGMFEWRDGKKVCWLTPPS